uniref:NET domain-containing protein n=1 Tax=Mesocestoides corti TaxID=53468 RepID=A0A5K3EQS0_MESCO
MMKVKDLKVIQQEPNPDPENTRSPETSNPPTNFESPADDENQIELTLFIPKEDEMSNSSLLLPIDDSSEDISASSSNTSDTDDATSDEDLQQLKLPQPTKRPNITELKPPSRAVPQRSSGFFG